MQATVQTASVVKTKLRPPVLAPFCTGFIVAFLACTLCNALKADEFDGPPGLVHKIAERETANEQARANYTYRQTVTVEDFDNRGVRTGEYKEVNDVIFSPAGERTEQRIGKPVSGLTRIKLTDEDFQDIRDVQPLLITKDAAFLYETKYQGEETVNGIRCYVLRIRPRQILSGQRLFDGMIWVEPSEYAIVRSSGKAVPEIRTMKSENLFPRFTTVREKIDGKYWFPAVTSGDDMLEFKTGPQRIRLTIRYTQYHHFSTDSTITFDK